MIGVQRQLKTEGKNYRAFEVLNLGKYERQHYVGVNPNLRAKRLDDLRSPLRFLLGHTELAKELSNLQIAPAENGAYTLSGIPKNMEQRITAFSITASAEGVIQSMRIEETDGAVNTFLFSDEKPNAPATDADFIFHAPAGTHMIDGMPPV